jgi:hypothetical protein
MPGLLPYGVGLFDFLSVYQRRPVRGTPLNHATKRATSRDVALGPAGPAEDRVTAGLRACAGCPA